MTEGITSQSGEDHVAEPQPAPPLTFNEKQRKRYKDDPEYQKRRKRWSKNYQKNNKDKVNAAKRKYYATENGKARILAAQKRYYEKKRGVATPVLPTGGVINGDGADVVTPIRTELPDPDIPDTGGEPETVPEQSP